MDVVAGRKTQVIAPSNTAGSSGPRRCQFLGCQQVANTAASAALLSFLLPPLPRAVGDSAAGSGDFEGSASAGATVSAEKH